MSIYKISYVVGCDTPMGSVSGNVKKYFVYMIMVIVAFALAPTLFSYTTFANNSSGHLNTPGWVETILPILVGVFFVLFLWRQNK